MNENYETMTNSEEQIVLDDGSENHIASVLANLIDCANTTLASGVYKFTNRGSGRHIYSGNSWIDNGDVVEYCYGKALTPFVELCHMWRIRQLSNGSYAIHSVLNPDVAMSVQMIDDINRVVAMEIGQCAVEVPENAQWMIIPNDGYWILYNAYTNLVVSTDASPSSSTSPLNTSTYVNESCVTCQHWSIDAVTESPMGDEILLHSDLLGWIDSGNKDIVLPVGASTGLNAVYFTTESPCCSCWSSSNTMVATVSSSGIVTAKAAGTVTISVIANGKSFSCTMTVVEGDIAIIKRSDHAIVGGTIHLQAVTVAGIEAITWVCANSNVATVDDNGVVTVNKVSSFEIIAHAEGLTSTSVTLYGVIPDGVYTMQGIESDLYLGVDETTLFEESNVLTSSLNDNAEQKWHIRYCANGKYVIRSYANPRMGIGLSSDCSCDSAHIVGISTTRTTFSDADTWTISHTYTGYAVRNASTGKALSILNVGNHRVVTTVNYIENCNNTEQRWNLEEVNASEELVIYDLEENQYLNTDKPIYLDTGDYYRTSAIYRSPNSIAQSFKWSSTASSSVLIVNTVGYISARSQGDAKISVISNINSNLKANYTVHINQTIKNQSEHKTTSTNGKTYIADPIEGYSGAHEINNTIMTLFGGQGLKITAHYNSTKLSRGSMGIGWYHDYEKYLKICECEIQVHNNPTTYLTYKATNVSNTYVCTSPNKNGHILTVDHSQQYPYIINCNSEYTEYYNANGKLSRIVNHQGFETLISYSDSMITITDTVTNKKMYLNKDNTGKIIEILDDASRSATLTYSGNLLTEIRDMNGNTLSYTYDNIGRVISGTDSKGVCYFTNTYDTYGRVSAQKDAIESSSKSVLEYPSSTKRVAKNRNGHTSTRIYDANGMLVSYTDENGNTKTYEYDNRFNVIKETDANGNSVTKVYNSFNKPTEITDKNGNKTYISYDANSNIVKIRYPQIGNTVPEETFVYNDRNQLIEHTDLRGTLTVYTYDSNGMPASKKIGNKNAILYTYENGLLVSETDALGHTTTFEHNTVGQVISKTDADNNKTSYEYDACGNLLKIIDSYNNSIVYTYDCNHQKTSVTDANDNKTEYSYNGNMKNDIVTTPDGYKVRYEFDGEDRPIKVTDQAGNVTTMQYDNAGRVVSKHFPDSSTARYEYDKAGNVVKEINPKGAVTTKTFDKAGNVKTVTDADGNVTQYNYNAMSKVVRVVNALSGTKVYEYSAAGDLLSETDELGNKKTYTYDAYGNRLTATDAKGNTTTYTYDANNNLLTVKDALNHVTSYTYNCLNQLISVKDAKNNIIRYGYDALGRRTTITDARNNVFTSVYDANGNVIKTVDAKGNTVSETTYNNMNLPVTVTDAVGKTTTYSYNALGKVSSVTDPMNNRQEYFYNSRGLNTRVKDAANYSSSVTYDALGNITKLSGPRGGSTNYEYDTMSRLVSESTVSGGTVSYTYNELNLRKQFTNAKGQVRKFFYDTKGRIIGYTCAEDTVSYTYDANGNVLTVTDKNGTVTREFDALNRVTKYIDTYGKVIRYEYDAVGNLTKLTYPDNTAVTYAYDENHNLVRVTDWANRVTTYTYDENNRVVSVTKPDGSVTTTVYDNMQRITSTVEKTASGAVITGFEYTYDDLSRIVEEKVLANSTKACYTYDNRSRVTNRTVKNLSNTVISTENFTHDAAGNITSAPNSCFQYDINNRLTMYNCQAVPYDMDGNMLSCKLDGKTVSFAYDSANRLISAGGHTYTYNAEDVRIRNLCADEDTTYTYNTNCKLSQLLMKTTNGVVTKYVYGRGLIGEEVNNAFKTYHFDCRGSTIAITDAGGNITDTFRYDTYGKLIERTGESVVIFGYNGRDGVVTDKNGLVYMRARYYSPETRRFVNADIVAGDISNAITLNRFAYANGNPVSFVDPFGLSAERGISFEWDVGITDIIGWGKDVVSIISSAYYRWKYGFSVYKKGAYAIVKGVRSFVTTNQGIQGTRYAFANASKYGNVFKYVSPKVAVKDALTGKGSIFGYAMVAVDTGLGIYENIQNGTRPQKIVSDAVVDAGLGIGSMALSAAAGAKIGALAGSVFPGLGNIIGAAGGALVGFGAYMLTDVININGKTGSEWIKEGAAVVADGLVDAGQWITDTAVDVWNEATDIVEDTGEWIADTASDVWNATTDFVEDAGEWIADTASDAWEATTDFFEDAGNAVGNFFSGLFSW